MTGYGQATRESDDIRVTVEVRGVNHRYADLRFRLPGEIQDQEAELRRRVLERVQRGRVEVGVRVEPTDALESRPVLNRPLLEEVVRAAQGAGRDLGLEGDLDLASVLTIPGMFRVESVEVRWSEERTVVIRETLDAALDAFVADRTREGEALREEIVARVERMIGDAAAAKQHAAALPEALRDRLLQRLSGLSTGVELDPARVAQEAAYLADRSDVTEEIVRLEGHLAQLKALCGPGNDEPLGKRLEFLLQEIHREANTVCSKSADLGLTRLALAIKLDVEKAREQVMNLE